MEYHLILNPAAGRGAVKKAQARLLEMVRSQLGEAHLHATASPGHATQIAAGLKERNAAVIAVGGDGTIHEIANGLVGGNCTLGIIPIGSGNDFIKMFNIPLDFQEAIQVIKRHKTMRIDVGKIGDSYFINGLGMGFDAEVVIETQKVKKLRGFFIYLYSVFKALLHYRNHHITLSVNGKTETREVFMISVGNGKYLGGGFCLTPGAELNDGVLDVCVFRGLRRKEVLLHLPKAIKGRHVELPQVECLRVKKLIVESSEGLPVHADGELLSPCLRRIEAGVLPGALTVIHNLA